MTTSRQVARAELVNLFTAALVGVGLPVKTVTGSKVENLTGLTPLVAILSKGSLRPPKTFQGIISSFVFEVQVFVLQATTGWTNVQAENALDEIESIISGVYEVTKQNGIWEDVVYETNTNVIEVAASGVPYYMELIPTLVRLAKS